MKKKRQTDMIVLLDEFNDKVRPWCEENKFSLHKAFEISRESKPEFYRVLSGLWSTAIGKTYLRGLFRACGGVLRKDSKDK